ncbi:MAG: hypothetical protein V3S98_07130, partial [Dehalococcoidia bacterium]
YLVEEGLLERQDGELQRVGDEPLAGKIPEGLRDVIGKRMTRLSEQCNQVLGLASVVGRDFRLDVLARVSDASEEQLYAALEEAANAAVIEQRASAGTGATFRFAHAFFRQTLYDEMFVPRRIRLHQQVGRALEDVHGQRTEEHAAEIAEHFSQSTELEDLTKALAYGEMAASRAMEVFAYGEAARLLEQALQVQAVLDPADASKRCDLLLALADALMPLGEPQRVVDTVAEEAYALTETIRAGSADPIDERSARVSRVALEGLHRALYFRAPDSPGWAVWTARIDAHAPPSSVLRAYADVAKGRLRMVQDRYEEGVLLIKQALEASRELDDREMLFTAAWQALNVMNTHQHWLEGVELAQEFAMRPHPGVSARTLGQIYEFCGSALLSDIDRDGADRAFAALFEIADRSNDAFIVINAMSFLGQMQTVDGLLEEAVATGVALAERANEMGMPGLASMANRAGRVAASYLESTVPWAYASGPGAAVYWARAGRLNEAMVANDSVLAALFPGDQETDAYVRSSEPAAALEVAIAAGDEDTAAKLVPVVRRLPPVPHPGIVSRDRILATAYVMLGQLEEARASYEGAIEATQRLRFRPELALSHLGLAELLLDSFPDERAEAIEHLDVAIAELTEMKMAPALEKAQSRKQGLGA